jgi:hypothetical protein
MPPNRTAFPRAHFPQTSIVPILLESAEQYLQPATFWKCIAVGSVMKKPSVSYNAWTDAFSLSPQNWIRLPSPKNEERLPFNLHKGTKCEIGIARNACLSPVESKALR